MSNLVEIGDPQLARQFLLQTFALSRADKLVPERLQGALRVALELASEGQPVVPLGFLSDLVHSLGGFPSGNVTNVKDAWVGPTPDASLTRRYEDYVLGKFAADMSLERATDELQKYRDRDRDRALAFALQQVQQRAALSSYMIVPAAIKALLTMNTTALQNEFFSALQHGFADASYSEWDELIQAVRNCGELLGAEDIFEIASGTALTKFGQRLALRQVMQASQHLVVGLPKQKPTGMQRHYTVATNILEEDLYPVGGFSSIANRGTIESLLRSELAYMEVDDRPDLFDIKYARDELLYYSRDENQFFRRRITVMFVLEASLSVARVKDIGAAWQRIVLTMASVVAMVATLTDWLASDALKFEVLFLSDLAKAKLMDERDVLELIFQEEIKSGRLSLCEVDENELRIRAGENARQSLCYCVRMHAESTADATAAVADWLEGKEETVPQSVWQPLLSELWVAQALPVVAYDEQRMSFEEASDPWREALRALLGSISP